MTFSKQLSMLPFLCRNQLVCRQLVRLHQIRLQQQLHSRLNKELNAILEIIKESLRTIREEARKVKARAMKRPAINQQATYFFVPSNSLNRVPAEPLLKAVSSQTTFFKT